MNKPLPLWPGDGVMPPATPCVQSGFCCRRAPCPFGSWDEKQHKCSFLTDDNLCAKYDEILAMPVEMWKHAPAFGAGCCMPLFNEARENRIRELRAAGKLPPGFRESVPRKITPTSKSDT